MNVLIIGSGGREHALCSELKKSTKVKQIYCFPGNAGTSKIANNIELDLNNFELLKDFITRNNIDIIIVGPEKPLVDGIVDYLEKNKIKVFGPNMLASKLEGSKIFTKKLCNKYQIPTPDFGVYSNIKSSLEFLNQSKYPLVIKADGRGLSIPLQNIKIKYDMAFYEEKMWHIKPISINCNYTCHLATDMIANEIRLSYQSLYE